MVWIEFVVAKYNEDVAWIKNLDTTKFRITVYDKSANGNLPNFGREAHTYLHHIIKRYNNLADVTVFVQGNPFDHVSVSRDELIRSINTHSYDMTEPFFNTRRIHEHTRLCNRTVKYLFGKNLNQDIYFTDGAQWIVKKENIINKPLEFWLRIYNDVARVQTTNWEDVVNPWTLEGVWQFLFDYTTLPK